MAARSFTINTKETAVLSALPSPKGEDATGEFVELEAIAREAFPKRGTSPATKGNSWVRNSLRKLLGLGLVKHGPGKSGRYARTRVTLSEIADKEKARVEKLEASKAAKTSRAAKAAKEPKTKPAKKAS